MIMNWNQLPKDFGPRLTFGVEIECVEFYNGADIEISATSRVKNKETGIVYDIGLEIGRYKTDSNQWVDHIIKAELCGIDNFATVRSLGCVIGSDKFFKLPKKIQETWRTFGDGEIETDSMGNLSEPWVEVAERKYLTNNVNPKTALAQAQSLLDKHGLKQWVADYDASLTDAGISGIELISPVLQMGEFRTIRRICNIFKYLVKTDFTCGLHIHIGCERPFEVEELRRIVRRWLLIEGTIVQFPIYQRMGVQNKPISNRVTLDKIEKATTIIELVEAVNGTSKAFTLNLRSLFKYGTIEFRGFHSTLDSRRIEYIAQFCANVVGIALI